VFSKFSVTPAATTGTRRSARLQKKTTEKEVEEREEEEELDEAAPDAGEPRAGPSGIQASKKKRYTLFAMKKFKKLFSCFDCLLKILIINTL
jgi:hypothetical protein